MAVAGRASVTRHVGEIRRQANNHGVRVLKGKLSRMRKMRLPAFNVAVKFLRGSAPFAVVARKMLVFVACALVVGGVFGVWRVRNQTRLRLERERARLERENFIPFEKHRRQPLNRTGLNFTERREYHVPSRVSIIPSSRRTGRAGRVDGSGTRLASLHRARWPARKRLVSLAVSNSTFHRTQTQD